MQAIILAAGMGKRLGKLTAENTKCMLEVHSKTLIERSIEVLINSGIKKVIIVVGYKKENLIKFLDGRYPEIEIIYVQNDIYFKTNNIYSLYLAKDELLKDDCLLLESDLIFDERIIKKLLESNNPNLAVVSKYESWMDGTVVEINRNDEILRFVPKKNFKYSEIENYYKTVNIYKFSKEFSTKSYVPFLKAYSSALGNNEYYEQVLRIITLLENYDLKALKTEGEKWYEIDDVQDFHNAETVFSPEEMQFNAYQKRYGGYWRFPQMIDFCYLVNPYFPPENMINEVKCYFRELLTQYPSGLDTQNILAANFFGIQKDFVLVANGATEIINQLGDTIEGTFGSFVPTFNEYIDRIDSKRIIKEPAQKPGYNYNYEQLIHLSNKVDNLILVNPDNPSGNYISKAEVLRLLAVLKGKEKKLILDESFVDFAENGEKETFIDDDILLQYPNLIVIKSISKSYGVPGIRLGIIATSNLKIIQAFRSRLPIWNINSFGEFFMQIFDKYKQLYISACKQIRAERDRFYLNLKTIDKIEVFPSQANYFLCKIDRAYNSTEIAKQLLKEYKILIKDLSNKPDIKMDNYIRIAIRNEMDNDKLFFALKKIFN